VGGTDFDAALSLAAVMPLLGLGTQLVEKDLPMPNAPYHELATWATINFAYTYKNEREIAELLALSCEPGKVERLLTAVRQRFGHRLAFAVEDAKMALSSERHAIVPLAFLEPGLAVTATRAEFDTAIRARTDRLARTARACIAAAGLKADAIDTIFLTGGSSRVPAVRAAISRAAPSARLAGDSDAVRRAGFDANVGNDGLSGDACRLMRARPRDQAGARLEGHIGPQPIEHHDQSVLEADQVQHVDHAPQQPGEGA
jgi:hypothetical chaperone protein